MNFQVNQLKRRNRDSPVRGGVVDSTQSTSVLDGDSRKSSCPPGSAEAVLEQGHAWLRFPGALEAEFLARTLEPRRRLLIIAGLVGLITLYISTLNLAVLVPDAGQFTNWVMLVGALCEMTIVLMPTRWRRNWQAETTTSITILVLNANVIFDCATSQFDTAFTHSAVIVSSVIFTCIAARLRFAWSLVCVSLAFIGYVTFVHGSTPLQEKIVASNIRLMAWSYMFVLAANYAFEYRERRNWLLRKVDRQQRGALKETSERLRLLSTLDPLTGLFNRRKFDSEMGLAWSKAVFVKEPVSMLMVDVDFFKLYNDTYGHPAGDTCLIQVGKALAQVAQLHGGIAARLGGEEFAILLPGRTQEDALVVGEALCECVRAARIEHSASTVFEHVTVSVGVAQYYPSQGGGAKTLVDLSDRALYHAKHGGRNRACRASDADCAAAALENQAEAVDVEPMASDAGSPAAGESVVVQLPPSPEAAYAQTLKGKFVTLRFPENQENDYKAHNPDQRRTQVLATLALGLIIFNFYLRSSVSMLPDIQGVGQPWQIGLSVAMLLLIATILVTKIPVHWAETLFSVGAAAMGVISAWMLSKSSDLTAAAFSICLVLIPMFAGVGARLSFRLTSVSALATCAAVAASFLWRPMSPLQTLVLGDSLLMIATNTVFTMMLAYTLEYGARKAWLLSNIEKLQGESLQAATRKLHDLSMLDPLTGICNRRQFETDFKRIWTESSQHDSPLSILIIDVDFFKLYNDGYGHPAGDLCLKQIAAVISQTAQEGKGLAARLGGEEFGILLPGATTEEAMRMGEVLCAAVRQAGIEHRFSKVPGHSIVTVSVGAACMAAGQCLDRLELFSIADDALYQSKHSGRNRASALTQNESSQPMAACAV